MRRNEWHAEYLILRVSRNSLSHFPRLAPPLWRTPLQQPRSAVVFETPGTLRKSFVFFSLKLANVEIKCDVLEGRWCCLFVFSFPIQWAESGIFPRCDARPQIFAWTGKLLLLLIVTCIKNKKKKTSATCSGESVMHCHVASSLKLVVPYAPLNSYNI